MRKTTMWFLTMSDINQAVQAQKQARSLKFWIYQEEWLYYLCSKNKKADQLICIFFCLHMLLVFYCSMLIVLDQHQLNGCLFEMLSVN